MLTALRVSLASLFLIAGCVADPAAPPDEATDATDEASQAVSRPDEPDQREPRTCVPRICDSNADCTCGHAVCGPNGVCQQILN